MKNFLTSTSLLLLILLTEQAGAERASRHKSIQLNLAAGNVATQVASIRAEVVQKQYVEMAHNNRTILNEHLQSLLDGSVNVGYLPTIEREVNAILSKAYEDSRLSCRSESVMGTNRKERICITMAQKRARYEQTQLDLQHDLVPKASSWNDGN